MLICNAKTLFDGKFVNDLCVRVAGGHIAELGAGLEPKQDEQVLDAKGAMLAPGFVDIHIHGYGGMDTMNGKEAMRHMAKGLVRHGVTGFLPTTMAAAIDDTRASLRAAHELMDERPDGARVLGCHLEGPFLNTAKKGAQPPQFIIEPTMDNYLKIAGGLEDAVKLMTIAPEVPGALELIRALSGKTALSAGHTDANVDQMEQAVEAGITQVTHLFNGMNPLNHRAPGVPGAALSDARIRVQIIADLLHLHRAVLKLSYLAKGQDGCLLITDAMEATGMPDGQYMLGANHVTVKNREARLADGTIAGSTLTLDRAVRNMVKVVGVPPEQAIHMASTAPANAIGEPMRGRIALDAHADLVLLDDEFEVLATIVGGELAYRK